MIWPADLIDSVNAERLCNREELNLFTDDPTMMQADACHLVPFLSVRAIARHRYEVVSFHLFCLAVHSSSLANPLILERIVVEMSESHQSFRPQ